MSPAVDIANLALASLSQHASITALTGTSLPPVALRCAQNIDIAKDSVLEASDWNFAARIMTFEGIADLDDGGGTHPYTYRYQFTPSSTIKPTIARYISVHEQGRPIDDDSRVLHQLLSEKRLQVPISAGFIRFVSREVDYADYPAEVITAVAAKLAYLIAMPITKSLKAQQAALEKFVQAIRDAERADAMHTYSVKWTDRPAALLDARRW